MTYTMHKIDQIKCSTAKMQVTHAPPKKDNLRIPYTAKATIREL